MLILIIDVKKDIIHRLDVICRDPVTWKDLLLGIGLEFIELVDSKLNTSHLSTNYQRE